jgi:hypothetical protein
MPTVLRFDGLRVVVYPNDHRPAHVHVIGNGCEAVFELGRTGDSPALRENHGFSEVDVNRIRRRIAANQEFLIDEWRKIHVEP